MDFKLLLIPAGIILIGIIVMVFLNKKGNSSQGKAQEVIKEYVHREIPVLQTASFNVINLLEDAINAQFIWVVAFNADGMHLLPTSTNPFNQTMKRYKDETPSFNWKKQLAANLFAGNKTENEDYVPFSAITNVAIDRNNKKIKIIIGEVSKSFKYQSKDCYGFAQDRIIEKFTTYLESTEHF